MFKLTGQDQDARTGILSTPHGRIETPLFLPVATKGCVKTLTPLELEELGYRGVISNAFHLYLNPGLEVIEKAGGLHLFTGWNNAIFTDSGGFQLIRRDFKFQVTGEGLAYRNNGRKHIYTPELCLEVQQALKSDIALTLDDCPAYGTNYHRTAESTGRTIQWAKRSMEYHKSRENRKQGIFAILQGGVYPDLREKCAQKLLELDFDGYGIGGLSIGEPRETTARIVSLTAREIPPDKPRYLMGVGSPPEILTYVEKGIDIFDSVYPTRNARHHTILTRKGNLPIRKARYKDEFKPLEPDCTCYTCQNFTRAYLHHLFRQKELLALRLATIHNLHHMQNLIQEIRTAIKENRYQEFKKEYLSQQPHRV